MTVYSLEFCTTSDEFIKLEVLLKLSRTYRKPPTINTGLIFVRKHLLMGLETGGLLYSIVLLGYLNVNMVGLGGRAYI